MHLTSESKLFFTNQHYFHVILARKFKLLLAVGLHYIVNRTFLINKAKSNDDISFDANEDDFLVSFFLTSHIYFGAKIQITTYLAVVLLIVNRTFSIIEVMMMHHDELMTYYLIHLKMTVK